MDKNMDIKSLYISYDDSKNYPFSELQSFWKSLDIASLNQPIKIN